MNDVSVDLGPNLTSMLERLASQLGITVQQVFPWYVHQAELEGIIFFIVTGVILFFFVSLAIISFRKAEWKEGNIWTMLCIISMIIVVIDGIAVAFYSIESATKIANPQLYAVRAISKDLGIRK